MVLSDSMIDTLFRGMSIPDNMTKLHNSKGGGFPTTLLLNYLGRNGDRRSTPLYNCWTNMKQRCLVGSDQQKKIKSYAGCTHTFTDYQDFAEFCYTLPFFKSLDQFGNPYETDKDLKGFLLKKPSEYGRDTVCMLPKDINCFLTCVQLHGTSFERSTKGVIQRSGKKFQVRVQDVCGDRKRKCMSSHSSHDEAYSALCRLKKQQACFLAEKFKGKVEDVVIEFLLNFDLNEWEDWTYQKWDAKTK